MVSAMPVAAAPPPRPAAAKQAAPPKPSDFGPDVAKSKVTPLAAGVGLKYYSPGCGTADTAVFTLQIGANDENTKLLTADLAAGKVTASTDVSGQMTSAVPTAGGIVGVQGGNLVT